MDKTFIIYLALIIVVFYFFMLRPEKKRKKQAEEMRNSLTIGSEITTIGGLTGTVVDLDDDSFTFETGEDRVRIKVKRWALSTNPENRK